MPQRAKGFKVSFTEEGRIRALVTGGTGLLGSYLVERLLEQGHQVRALARRASDVSHLKTTGAEIVFGDVEDYDSLPPAVEGVDVVFHAAAKVTPGWGSWQEFEAPIVKGTENLLRASAEAGVSRFLYVSSGSIYGKNCWGDNCADESAPCELPPLSYDTYYDHAKLQAEKLALDYHKQGKLKVTVIRPGMIYGPRDRLHTDRVYRHMAMTRPLIVWPGKSNPWSAHVFVTDVADCAILAATSDQAVGQVYNVAPPNADRFRDYANTMIRAQGGPRLQLTIPYALAYLWCTLMEGWARLRRMKEQPYLTRSGLRFLNKGMFINGSKAKRELGWEPKVSMDEGNRLYVQWRRSQAKK